MGKRQTGPPGASLPAGPGSASGPCRREAIVRACPICPVRRAVAARVAESLRRRGDLRVGRARGRLGELSVALDGVLVFHSRGILVAPDVERILRQLGVLLDREGEAETTRVT